jgi:hypothetical protein
MSRLRRLITPAVGALVLVCALAAATPAPARSNAAAIMVLPHRTVVSRHFRFAVGHLGRHVRKVIFFIDGRRLWSTTRAPFRYRGSGWFNAVRLHPGRHVLGIEVIYYGGRRRFARKAIVVARPRRSHSVATTASAAANVGVVGATSTAGPSVAMFNRFAYGDFTSASDASQYQFIDLGYGSSAPSQATVASLISSIHASDPNMKALLYKAAMARPSDPTAIGACVTWNPSLPYGGVPLSWFLHDSSGAPIYNAHYNFYWLDYGNPAVQQACLNSAVAEAKQSGFNGIFFDNIAGSLYWAQIPACTGGSFTCQSDANWQASIESFLRYEAAGLHAHGLFAFGNISGGAITWGGAGPAIWAAYQQTGIDGAMEESFTSGTNKLPVPISQWRLELWNEQWSEANGKYLLANADVFSNEALNVYGLATLMLAGNGHSSWDTAAGNYYNGEYTFPEYATARQLGAPAGPYRVLGNGVYERPYSNGIVLVNPTKNTTSRFSLGGHIYSGSGLTDVTMASMAPNSGLILLKVG